jgi:hypothetical protein
LSVSQPNSARRSLSLGVGRAIRSTSRRLGLLPIEAGDDWKHSSSFLRDDWPMAQHIGNLAWQHDLDLESKQERCCIVSR